MRLRRQAAALLALCALVPYAVAQTYTNKNLPGVTAYSGFAGAPTAGVFAPYSYAPPPTPVAGRPPSAGGCTGLDLTGAVQSCVPVTIAGSAAAGYWLVRNGQPYWFKCVRAHRGAALRTQLSICGEQRATARKPRVSA